MASTGERDDTSGKGAGCKTDVAQIPVKRRDIINPGQAGNEHDQAVERHPRLHRDGGGELDPEIFREGHAPRREEKPARRKKGRCGQAEEK